MVPCYFIFGDSLVDKGNNNQLNSLARADYLPYGIDFNNGPTGRFCNGKTTVDVIAELLGFDDYIPPYSTASGRQILGGGARINFSGQVKNYHQTVSQVVDLLGDEDKAADYLNKCIYSIGLGSNDYLNNYFMPLCHWMNGFQALYDYGARKFVLIGLGQIGCSPNELAQNSGDGRTCVERINAANRLFNNKLRGLVDQFNNANSDAKFIYINAYGIFQDITSNPAAYGFRVTNAGCCGVGRNNGQITCLPFQTPCENRDEYMFWDAFHPRPPM
ncbi:GDSL esterase/lipase [Hibiscus syriacus]|uniref:GDSL esterase/lipase n=1 Tax=Hibiscus syriacus TaxID=106335 RepID=A0A6A2X960_HIBSY|nr:GDSL esterase/lipase [Hibiscus syriacus]